jgi:predicted TIM-barrel fold metal-dependent hydrolase
MSLDRIVEALIKEAQERGEFDNLPGKGKPIDLTEYFEMPEEIRVAQSVLKNAGMTSPEVQLLKEIAELRQILTAMVNEKKKEEIQKKIQEKQIEFNLMMERQKRQRNPPRKGK